MMFSFDFTSLFTKVPVPKILNIIKEKLSTDSSLPDRTNLSTNNNEPPQNVLIHRLHAAITVKVKVQRWGLLSPIIANIFIEYFEEIA